MKLNVAARVYKHAICHYFRTCDVLSAYLCDQKDIKLLISLSSYISNLFVDPNEGFVETLRLLSLHGSDEYNSKGYEVARDHVRQLLVAVPWCQASSGGIAPTKVSALFDAEWLFEMTCYLPLDDENHIHAIESLDSCLSYVCSDRNQVIEFLNDLLDNLRTVPYSPKTDPFWTFQPRLRKLIVPSYRD